MDVVRALTSLLTWLCKTTSLCQCVVGVCVDVVRGTVHQSLDELVGLTL